MHTKFISSWVKKSVFCWIFLAYIYFSLQFMVILVAETINEENEKNEKRRNEKKGQTLN